MILRYQPNGEAKNSGFLLDRGRPLSESKELDYCFYLFTGSVFFPTHLAEIRTTRVIAVHVKLLGCTACNGLACTYSYSRCFIFHTRGSEYDF
jgi:hypothetical protein